MNSVISYIVIIIVLYSMWTIIMEAISKNYSSCFCITLKTYIFAGIMALILMYFHVKNDCKHHDTLKDIINTPIIIIIGLILVSLVIIISNKYWLKAVTQSNSGFVSALSNVYIVIVAILSAFLFKSKIKQQHYFGILAIVGGSYLLTK